MEPHPLDAIYGTSPTVNTSVYSHPLDAIYGSPTVNKPTPTQNMGMGQIPPVKNAFAGVPVLEQLSNFGAGALSTMGQSLLNIPKAIIGGAESLVNYGRDLGGSTEKVDFSNTTNSIEQAKQNLYVNPLQEQLNTTSGNIGEVAGTMASYAAPGSYIGKGASLLQGARMFQGAGLLPMAGRVLAGVGVEGAGNAALGYLGSGGDTEQAKLAGITGGVLKGTFSGLGEVANKLQIPQKIVGPIFKIDKKEAKDIISGTNVESFNDWALNVKIPDTNITGLKGNTIDVARQVSSILDDSESKIFQEFAKKDYPSIYVEEPSKFIRAIENKINLLRKSGATNEARGLEQSIKNINPQTGEMNPTAALSLRRFLDGLRIEKSYLAPTEELSAQQAGLKEMTEELRHKINSVGVTGEVMRNYSRAMQAFEALAKKAKSENNTEALGLIGTVLMGQSVASLSPTLAGATIARQLFNTTKGRTTVAQTIKNLPKSSPSGGATRAVVSQTIPKTQ